MCGGEDDFGQLPVGDVRPQGAWSGCEEGRDGPGRAASFGVRIIKPQELLATTGDINKVRDQIIGDLEEQFQSGGVRIKRRLYETVVKPMTDRAEVTDAGDGEKYGIYRGEVVSINQIEEVNKKILATRGALIKYTPTLLSVGVAPYHSDDFVGKLMFERPHVPLIAAPAVGAAADIKAGHPVTLYVFGKYVVGAK